MPTFEQIQQEIEGMLTIPEDELTEEQQAAMQAYLDELAGMESGKVDAFGQFLKMQAAVADACKKEAQRLSTKAKIAENRIAGLKGHYLTIMQQHGIKKASGTVYTLKIRETDSVDVMVAADALPEIFVRRKVTVEPDKTVIRDALKGGVEIEGCRLVKSCSLQVA